MKTSLEILSIFDSLSNKKKVEILLTALSYMQRYNGRSINDCIILSMGYEEQDGLWIKKINNDE